MRIGIDITPILPPRTGIGRSTLALLQEMIPAAPDDEFILFVNSARRDPPPLPLFERPNVRVRRYILPGPWLHALWRTVRFPPIEWFTGAVDVFHSPWGPAPPQRRGAGVITVHDLHCLKHPGQTERWGGQWLAKTLPASARRADRIIAVSHHTRREAVQLLGVPEDKIEVIYHGVDRALFHPRRESGVVEAVRSEYCLPSGFLLAVGTLEPRKNLLRLLEAFARFIAEVDHPPRLVIAGREGPDARSIKVRAEQLNLTPHLQFTGFVAEEHLPAIYNAALALVHPALEEGFGMTVLEAMASGLPVAASDIPVFRELYGEACCWFDPNDPEDMADAMLRIATSGQLREALRTAGERLAARYSWKTAAEKTLSLYRSAAKTTRFPSPPSRLKNLNP
ncbi:MAG: glycosyltransferase family 1 protein [Candidatus Sumerlaeia bacterium]